MTVVIIWKIEYKENGDLESKSRYRVKASNSMEFPMEESHTERGFSVKKPAAVF